MKKVIDYILLFDAFPQQKQFSAVRGQSELRSFFGLLFTMPVIVISAIYMISRLQILIGKHETTIIVTEDLHTPFVEFNFTTSEPTPDESYTFQFVWSVFDTVTLQPPADLAKIGHVSMYITEFYYDPVANTRNLNQIDLAYHKCTALDR